MFLAQVNIALFRWPLDDTRMAEFVDRVVPINELAESSEGFVWRYTETGMPQDLGSPWNDPRLFFNLSLWRDVESLKEFVFSAEHAQVMRDRAQWTTPVPGPSLAMWWIDENDRPTVQEAIWAINLVAQIGDSEHAFSFRKTFPEPQR